MTGDTQKEINKLQDNLQTIRKVAKWTIEELGDKIGVTKQTISNLENKKTTLTKTQYIAIRAVLDYEMLTNPDNATLATIVDILLNSEEESDTSDLDAPNDIPPIPDFLKKKSTPKKNHSATNAGSLAFMATVGATSWLAKIISDSKKK